MASKELNSAKKCKNDEFYTTLEDIHREMIHYADFFKGKVVYCNCDDYTWSNFWKYFKDNFAILELRGLIATGYNSSGRGFLATYDGKDIAYSKMEGNGDFRSDECVKILQKSDVIVTNPPFSLFREYVTLLMNYGKKFLILGDQNALTYKDIFPYIKNNELWWGVSIHSGDRKFYVPDTYPLTAATCGIDEDGKRFVRVKGIRWWTNLDNSTRNTSMELSCRYNANDYPMYDNYNAIEVSKTCNIPMDYDDVMGVPITFFDKYCPHQFDIIGITENADYLKPLYITGHTKYDRPYLHGKRIYSRLLIKKKFY